MVCSRSNSLISSRDAVHAPQCFPTSDNQVATDTQEEKCSSCDSLKRFNRSLMRSSRSETLHPHPYNQNCHLHNLTSRSFSLSADSVLNVARRQSAKRLTHLNRYHHQFPLDLQGWPRRWTQTVLFPHFSVVI